MTSSEQEVILSEIASSNFDEAMYLNNNWKFVKDNEFHELLKEYNWAREALAELIGWED